ncbi:hypothetical protein Q3G72_027714 [Acer saccharum]|nr:hypothetical protein Q3G72_027714 [Acer saccharum]
MVWMEEETEHMSRFDRGRILILGPQDQNLSSNLKVQTKKNVWRVRIVESSDPVSKVWVDEFLGLRPMAVSDKHFQNQDQTVGKGCQVVGSHVEEGSQKERVLSKLKEKNVFLANLLVESQKEASGKSSFLDKGKEGWLSKPKVNNRRNSNPNGCIRIGKVKESNQILSSREDSSSSESGLLEGAVMGPKLLTGECSKPKINNRGNHSKVDSMSKCRKIDKGIEICNDLKERKNQNLREEGQIKEEIQDRVNQKVHKKKVINKGRIANVKTHPMTTRKSKDVQRSNMGA